MPTLHQYEEHHDWLEMNGIPIMRHLPGCCENCGAEFPANGDPRDRGCPTCGYDPCAAEWEQDDEPEPYDLSARGALDIERGPFPKKPK
jgi:hypothetical protein